MQPVITAIAALVLSGCLATTSGAYGGNGYTRDQEQRSAFVKSNPCPSTGKRSGGCPGWQVDHRKPLAAGGSDHPSNMQWLTVEQHKAKSASERRSGVYIYRAAPKKSGYSYKRK